METCAFSQVNHRNCQDIPERTLPLPTVKAWSQLKTSPRLKHPRMTKNKNIGIFSKAVVQIQFNLWMELRHAIWRRHPSNLRQLEQFAQKECAKMTSSDCFQRLRCKMCFYSNHFWSPAKTSVCFSWLYLQRIVIFRWRFFHWPLCFFFYFLTTDSKEFSLQSLKVICHLGSYKP